MSGFTKGPWEWVKSNNENWSSYDLSPGVLTKDTADGTPWGDEIDRANAHLISAAPELYESLNNIVNSIFSGGSGVPFLDEAQEALSKARGES